MRFVTYLTSENQHRVGIVYQNTMIDVEGGLKWLSASSGSPISASGLASLDILTIIRKQDEFMPLLRSLLAAYQEKKLPQTYTMAESQVRLISPIPRPLSMRDGYAFRQHVEAARRN